MAYLHLFDGMGTKHYKGQWLQAREDRQTDRQQDWWGGPVCIVVACEHHTLLFSNGQEYTNIDF